MSDVVIRVENLYKEYRLGTISHGTLHRDLQSWWARVRGKEDPNSLISHHDRLPGPEAFADNPHILALTDVTFDVHQGDVLGIIGRNGAGKSTLLKILSEVTAPTKGTVKMKGRVASLLEVGTGFHSELTGRENVYLNGAILGMTKREITRKFDEIVDFAEIEKFIDTPVKRYSSGMYVRLAFAVAAHLEPEILIVDEVLAVGDAQFQKKCLGKMGDVAKGGRTVLFVSHNMAAVQNLCSSTLVLSNGSLVFSGKVDKAIEWYFQNDIGQGTMDLHDGKERSGNGLVRFTKITTCNMRNEIIDSFPLGQGCKIYLDYECAKGFSPHNVEVGVAFISVLGLKVAMFSNVVANQPFHDLSPVGRICCTIPSVPLTHSEYVLGISISCNGETCDWVDKAMRISISEGDFYKSGRLYYPGSTLVYLPHNWTTS
ncbi:MAG: ABC transporter ATP-binding protein [Nitrospirae bacterium]|nr:ABC transporter ATP-binding protein [Nitrospirota bacterium]